MSSPRADSGAQTGLDTGRQIFGKRNNLSTITIERHGKSRRYKFSALGVSVIFSVFAMFLVGYFSATAYLVLRDDLIGMTHARNARLLHEYEDRIAGLRANLDRITSRQLLDQQAIEAKVAELIKRQEMLGSRSSKISGLMEKAAAHGLQTSAKPTEDLKKPAATEPVAKEQKTGSLAPAPGFKVASMLDFQLRGASGDPIAGADNPVLVDNSRTAGVNLAADTNLDITNLASTHMTFANVGTRIKQLDQEQRILLEGLRFAAVTRTEKISLALAKLGVEVPVETDATGGPLLPPQPDEGFERAAFALDQSLTALDTVLEHVRKVPTGSPLPGAPVSSAYGNRIDPFLKTRAMHSGIDFRAKTGTPVKASASGTVVSAGYNGGYGLVVVIKHANGLSTRYAHLSRASVKEGQKIEAGMTIGKVGSTGRSTGPHLHFEIRRNGKPTNPSKFLMAGRSIAGL
ncbi:MAG: M23 family metallopeptidase [Pseudomonadota bacterium]